jgi:hypothetical protein
MTQRFHSNQVLERAHDDMLSTAEQIWHTLYYPTTALFATTSLTHRDLHLHNGVLSRESAQTVKAAVSAKQAKARAAVNRRPSESVRIRDTEDRRRCRP